MKFEDVAARIGTLTDLRRIAGAHVVDHRQLSEDELQGALLKVKPQYLHEEPVRSNVEQALYRNTKNDMRVLSYVLLVDVLLDQFEFLLPISQAEERVIAFEQSVVNRKPVERI